MADPDSPANWKLLVDAFLENYHIKCLHQRTIYPFFLDAVSMFDRLGVHLRAATSPTASMPRIRGNCTLGECP